MKITVLGGAGDMGFEAVNNLCRFDELSRIVIADKNINKAKKLAEGLKDKRVSVVELDALNPNNLIEVMKENDSIINCVGPSSRFEKTIVKSAIDAKVPYVSLCDDSKATMKVMEMSQLAESANVPILLGLGNCPGITNVLSKWGAEKMDEVEKINIYWMGGADDAEGLANFEHAIETFAGKAPMYINGNFVEVESGTGLETVEFPKPIGSLLLYFTPHAEPTTIPLFIKVKEVTIKGGIQPQWLTRLGLIIKKTGLLENPKNRQKLAKFFHNLLPKLTLGKKKYIYSALKVNIYGKKDGKEVFYWGACVDRMKRITSTPVAIGAIMLAKKEISRAGIFPPEAVIEPITFIKKLRVMGINVYLSDNSDFVD